MERSTRRLEHLGRLLTAAVAVLAVSIAIILIMYLVA